MKYTRKNKMMQMGGEQEIQNESQDRMNQLSGEADAMAFGAEEMGEVGVNPALSELPVEVQQMFQQLPPEVQQQIMQLPPEQMEIAIMNAVQQMEGAAQEQGMVQPMPSEGPEMGAGAG